MSLLISLVRPEMVRIACDTQALLPSGERIEVTKFLAMPHARMFCAVQGDPMILAPLFELFCLSHRSWDLDQAIAEAPRALAGFVLRMRQAGTGGGYRLFLAGYSPSRGRMAANVWEGDVADNHVDDEEIGVTGHGHYIAPWRGPSPATPTTTADFIAIAQQQLVMLEEAETAGGGRLLLVELMPERISIETVHHFQSGAHTPEKGH